MDSYFDFIITYYYSYAVCVLCVDCLKTPHSTPTEYTQLKCPFVCVPKQCVYLANIQFICTNLATFDSMNE